MNTQASLRGVAKVSRWQRAPVQRALPVRFSLTPRRRLVDERSELEVQPRQASGPDGDQRLGHLETTAQRVRFGIEKKGASRVVISGGEASLHPEFMAFIAYAKELGYRKIQTVTNGYRFGEETFLKQALDAGLGEITYSLHGHTTELHDRLTRASRELRWKRRSLVPDRVMQRCAREFADDLGYAHGSRRLWLGFGAILMTAVIDERSGASQQVVARVREWAIDPHRFDPRWIDAVERALERGRNL